MDSESLRMFQAVAEEGSVTRAAGVLHCVPSNVTTRIRGLEEEVGERLFFRKPRGMSLTPAGSMLLGYARRVGDVLTEARASMDNFRGPAGRFRVGATESVLSNWLAERLIEYVDACPRVDLSLVVETSQSLIDGVLGNGLEAAIVSREVDDPSLTAVELQRQRLVLVAARSVVDPARAAAGAVVLQRKGCSYRAALEEWLRIRGIALGKMLELPSADMALMCVERGMGVAAMPVSTVERLGYGGRVALFDLPDLLRFVPTTLIRAARSSPTKAHEAFEAVCLGRATGG